VCGAHWLGDVPGDLFHSCSKRGPAFAAPATRAVSQSEAATRQSPSRRAFRVLRQSIVQRDPTQLASDPRLVLWRHSIRVVEAGCRNVDFGWGVFGFERQLRAAVRTEAARAPRGRLESSGYAERESEMRPFHAEPRDRWCAGGSAAVRAVAARLVAGRIRRLVADPPAKASTLEHCGSLVVSGFIVTHDAGAGMFYASFPWKAMP
jgi:hypothetical protein